jgi:hypothetical protein
MPGMKNVPSKSVEAILSSSAIRSAYPGGVFVTAEDNFSIPVIENHQPKPRSLCMRRVNDSALPSLFLPFPLTFSFSNHLAIHFSPCQLLPFVVIV